MAGGAGSILGSSLIVLSAGFSAGGFPTPSDPSALLRKKFVWYTQPHEPTTGMELCVYTPFEIRCEHDTPDGSVSFTDKNETLKPTGITLDATTGFLTGIPTEMDTYVPGFQIPDGFQIDEQSYATFGSASLYGATNGEPITHAIKFTAIATLHSPVFGYPAGNETLPISIERDFYIPILNNWSSDRDYYVTVLNTPGHNLFIDGNIVIPEVFLASMKSRGWYTSPCLPADLTILQNVSFSLSTSANLIGV